MTRRPLQVVAHRGASHEVAEHTLAAYVTALDQGADGLECDVRLTADGHLVCVHDRTLRRVAMRNGLISTMDLADLEELDFASWKTPSSDEDSAAERDPLRTGVLTLRRLLETVSDYDRRVELVIETKHPTRYGGLVEKRLAEQLHEFGMDARRGEDVARARVMSFSFSALQRMERLAPSVPLVQLIEKQQLWSMLKRVTGPDWILGPGIDLLREKPRLARAMREAGHAVHVWTVNTPDDLELCLSVGVEVVITDRPAYLLELLGR